MTESIFDDISSANISTYWTTLMQQEAPYLGEVLFPNTRIPNDDVTWYRGKTRAAKPLAPSAYGAQAIQRDRQGYERETVHANFFKEGKYLDESLRRDLLRVASSPIQGQKDIILQRIFQDSAELLRGAALSREIVRMQLLQSGKYSIAGNGQVYADDYEMKANHIANAATAWGTSGATPIDDFRRAKDIIGTEEGVTLSRVVMNQKTFNALLADEQLKATILANNANTALATVPQSVLLDWIKAEYDLTIQVYDKSYTDASGALQRFVTDGNVVLLPDGDLGSTAFAPTPEETDLLATPNADVSVVDTGVAVTTTMETDPVTKMTKVSQTFVPTFEQIDGVYVLKAFSSASGNTQVSGGTGTGNDDTPKTVAVTGVTLDKTTANATVGDVVQLSATIAPADATNKKLSWKSSDDTLVTVDANGKATMVKAGTADVSVTTEDGSKSAKCTFTIADKAAAPKDDGTDTGSTTTPPEA